MAIEGQYTRKIGRRRTWPTLTGMAPFEDAETTEFSVTCPYCGEQVELYLEPDVMGTLVQDCEVCCRPWQVHVTRDQEYRYVDVTRADE